MVGLAVVSADDAVGDDVSGDANGEVVGDVVTATTSTYTVHVAVADDYLLRALRPAPAD